MSLLMKYGLRTCSNIIVKLPGVVECPRSYSRHFPNLNFTKRDAIRLDRFLKRTSDLMAGNDSRKKKNTNSVDNILKSLNSDPSEQLKNKLNNLIINKLPRGTTPRMRQLGTIFFDHIVSIFQTGEVGSDLLDLGFEITNVTVAPGLSSVIISWQLSDPEKESQIMDLFPKSSSAIKQALASMRVIGHVPPIMFHKDTSKAALEEIDHLLSIADMGPKEEMMVNEELSEDDSWSDPDQIKEELKHIPPNVFNFQKKDDKIVRNAYGVDYDKIKEELMNVKNKVPGKLRVETPMNKIVEIDVEHV